MQQSDSSPSVTALIVVLALTVILYFTLRVAVPELPLLVHHALAKLPSVSEQVAKPLSMLR